MISHTRRRKSRSNWALKISKTKRLEDQLSPSSQKVLQKLKKSKIEYNEVDISEMRALMDEYAVRGMHLLWDIIVDENHEWHRRFGFEALKILIQHTLPKRKELAGQVEQNVEVNLASLFHGNKIESAKALENMKEIDSVKAIEEQPDPTNAIEIIIKEEVPSESEGSGSDS